MDNPIEMDLELPPALNELYDVLPASERSPGSLVQQRFSKLYRPWAHSAGQPLPMERSSASKRTVYTAPDGWHFLTASYLLYLLPQITVKDPSKCQIRLRGDFHDAIVEAELSVDKVHFHLSNISLDSGLMLDRTKRSEYMRYIGRLGALRQWSDSIAGGEIPVPQLWPYSMPFEAVPLYTGCAVKHSYLFELRIEKLFEMRVKIKSDAASEAPEAKKKGKGVASSVLENSNDGVWKTVTFDFALVDVESKSIAEPELWGLFERLQSDEVLELATTEVEKRWFDYIVQPSVNPQDERNTYEHAIKLTTGLPVRDLSWVARQCNENAPPGPSTRYLTPSGREPFVAWELRYGSESRLPALHPAHCDMQRFFKTNSDVLTPGFGHYSFANVQVGAETPATVNLKEKQATLYLTLCDEKAGAKYDIFVVICVLKRLIFKKSDTHKDRVRLVVNDANDAASFSAYNNSAAYRSGDETFAF